MYIYKKYSMRDMHDRALLLTSYVLNIGAFFAQISVVVKGILLVCTGITTILALLNQYKTFSKNYRTLWIVVQIDYVFSKISPKSHNKSAFTKKRKINEPK